MESFQSLGEFPFAIFFICRRHMRRSLESSTSSIFLLSRPLLYRLLDQTTSSNVVTVVVAAAVSSWLGDTIVPVAWSIAQLVLPTTVTTATAIVNFRNALPGFGFMYLYAIMMWATRRNRIYKLQDPERSKQNQKRNKYKNKSAFFFVCVEWGRIWFRLCPKRNDKSMRKPTGMAASVGGVVSCLSCCRWQECVISSLRHHRDRWYDDVQPPSPANDQLRHTRDFPPAATTWQCDPIRVYSSFKKRERKITWFCFFFFSGLNILIFFSQIIFVW
jgi:hypothetical protein